MYYFFQVDEPSVNKVMKYIELGIKQNAKLEAGGKRVGNNGYFVEPTVFSNVTDDMAIATDEVSFYLLFGPSISSGRFLMKINALFKKYIIFSIFLITTLEFHVGKNF